ncbi:protein translocase subunit SecF [Gorillibacterium sp. sgz5001074]|uniref:protein translocase subunit SecF n=1 Tax=Gorillibacterium sp. sgz5001074 TaxID=3446695 RepID=UPI003F67C002
MLYKWLNAIDYVKNRKKFFAFSITITILGILTLAIFGLNRGVDFKAGTTLDVNGDKPLDKARVEALIKEAGFEAKTLTIAGSNNNHATARFDTVLAQADVTKVMDKLSGEYGTMTKEENTVDTELANELALKALYAVLIASLGIIVYVSIRFEWRFAVAGIVALLHDAFIVISLFSIFRWEVNLPFVAAILTIIGYSINDTIVIFDRVRENMRFAKLRSFNDLADLVNASIRQTMTRSINTVFTVFIGALLLFIFGSESIKYFSLAMILGLVSGAYSSIFIASPVWILLKNASLKRPAAPAAAKE